MAKGSLELLKGTLDVLILKTLSWGAMHGYEISRWIRQRTDEAFQVEEGALYPALRRVEKRGWVQAEWGISSTGREARFYELTGEGRRELESQIRGWDRYAEAMRRVLHATEAPA